MLSQFFHLFSRPKVRATDVALVVADIGLDDPMRGDCQAIVGTATEIAKQMGAELLVIDKDTLHSNGTHLVPHYKSILGKRRPDIVISTVNDAKTNDDPNIVQALAGLPGETLHVQGNPQRLARHYCDKSIFKMLERTDELIAHKLTPEKLAAAGAEFDKRYPADKIKGSLIAIMLTNYESHGEIRKIAELISREGDTTVFLCGCKRTSPSDAQNFKATLQQELAALNTDKKVNFLTYTLDQRGYNPYQGLIARAKHYIVSGYSVSMVCEALTTGRTVHITRDGHETAGGKGYPGLRKSGYVKYVGDYPAGSKLQTLQQEPLNITTLTAASIIEDFRRMIDKKKIPERGAPNDHDSWGSFKTVVPRSAAQL